VTIPHKERLSNLAYEAIKEMIGEYRFQPGARINVERLTRELGVSRTPVWQAIMRLEQEGLLKNIANRGVYLIQLSLQESLYLYQVREVLESLAARLAAESMDDDTIDLMARNLEAQKGVVENGDLLAYSSLDYEFHAAVYGASGNPYLQESLELIKKKMRPLALHLQPFMARFYKDHTRLFLALKARDPEASERAFKAHNRFIVEQIAKMMAQDETADHEPGGPEGAIKADNFST
jgi:DNA-binding GntR family transcriptional regulator